MAAYRKLTGKNLAAIIAEVTPFQASPDAKAAAVPPEVNDVDELHQRGVEKINKGDLNGALADFTRAIKMSPENAAGYTNRGHVRLLKGDLDEAGADYSRAIEVDPEFGTAYRGRANARHMSGDVKGAIADATR
jgi:Tfp pilus assembly protein PilF